MLRSAESGTAQLLQHIKCNNEYKKSAITRYGARAFLNIRAKVIGTSEVVFAKRESLQCAVLIFNALWHPELNKKRLGPVTDTSERDSRMPKEGPNKTKRAPRRTLFNVLTNWLFYLPII
ncbi:MAG: hypothetical protein P4L53_29245 [Candidatus Obscuribacterales bacterium]|nr:hypothetical protein [Candidatus Obscuribacterales bacterium]